ncbi:alpha/beta fold hydrolase [Pseudonocardia acaciae]|uniref:alpha/beta fold hydrolase n=1 Tax=Pseudonocardia acaciae TaxID=551276 RepID=UPI0005673C4A|nr:alpha/beta hydrolase [Pseudonocardia acaciae]
MSARIGNRFGRVLLASAGALAILIGGVVGCGVAGQAAPAPPPAVRSGYAPVNGLNMYYEIHGAGEPLVLLHGALMTLDEFGPLLTALARDRQVIAVELQAHGRTADVDRPLSYQQMADDIAGLLYFLNIARADVMGYSMGGGVALQTAIRHPGMVRKLVVASASISTDGTYPQMLEAIRSISAASLAGSPFERSYARRAPDPAKFPTLVEKVKQLDLTFTGMPEDSVRSIAVPTLVMLGDADIIRPEHGVELLRLLGGGMPVDLGGTPRSQLAVLPGTGHISLVERTDWIHSMVDRFLTPPPVPARG